MKQECDNTQGVDTSYEKVETIVADLLNEIVRFVDQNTEQDTGSEVEIPSTDISTNRLKLSSNSKEKASQSKYRRECEANEYRRYICYWCDRRFDQYHRLRLHVAVHSEKARVKCTLCDKSFTQKSSLSVHMLSHTGERPFKCHICLKGFVTASKLKKHVRVHTGEKPFVCNECPAKFRMAVTLRKHKERHANGTFEKPKEKKMLKCRFCGALFEHKVELKKHKQEQHLKKKRPYTNQTDTSCVPASAPKSKEGDFTCGICPMKFNFKRHFLQHMKNHNNSETREEKKVIEKETYKCFICDIKFKYSYHLDRHMTLHSNLRPHVCTECNGTYKTKQDLHRHQKIHAADRPHKCPMCGKGFVQTSGLKRHLRTHTGAKPFVCEVCNQGFSQSSSMKKHKEKKHPVAMNQQQQPQEVEVGGMATVQDILNWIGRNEDQHEIEISYT